MSLYFSAEHLGAAIRRLQESAAKGRLVDYLILRRSLVLAAPNMDRATMLSGQVTLSMRDELFMQAVYEMTAAARSPALDAAAPTSLYDLKAVTQTMDLGWTGLPYFQVLGTAGETEHGYRQNKYRSNGTADTVTKSVFVQKGLVEIVPNTRPRAIRLGPGHAPGVLAEAFLGSGVKPLMDDLAVWWHRSIDLQVRFGGEPTAAQLVDVTAADLGLSGDEISELFDGSPTDIANSVGDEAQT